MWVSPKARGRGVGDRLIGAVVEWARAVTLAVSEGNAAATALYRRHGFVDTGERQDMPDGVRQEWIMRLKLT
jgi:ribosomal protein S18 acetylase RimI-like enzyme